MLFFVRCIHTYIYGFFCFACVLSFRWSCVPLVCPVVCVLLVFSWIPDNHTHAHTYERTHAHGDF